MGSSNGKIVAAFIAGLAAGAGLGILLAPDKGSNTRRQLRESFDSLSEKAKEGIEELGEKAKEQFDKYRARKSE